MPSKNTKAAKSSSRVDILSPLTEVGQVGELIVTKSDFNLTRPIEKLPPRFQVIEPMAPPPQPLRIGTPGEKDRVAFNVEKADPELSASIDNLAISREEPDNVLTRRLAQTAPLTIDSFEQIIDEVLRQTGTNLWAKAAEIDPEPKKIVSKIGNVQLPNDHSDYLRNRPDDPLGFAIESYMSEETRHFQPIESLDFLVDFYVNGCNPDITVHHQLVTTGATQPFITDPPKDGVSNLCLTCNNDGHVPTYCECCRERNAENAEKMKKLPPKKMPANMPAFFDTFHTCSPDNPDCTHMCKVAEKTKQHYSKGSLVPQAFSYNGDPNQVESDNDFWLRRYRKSMSRLGHDINNLEQQVEGFQSVREQQLLWKQNNNNNSSSSRAYPFGNSRNEAFYFN